MHNRVTFRLMSFFAISKKNSHFSVKLIILYIRSLLYVMSLSSGAVGRVLVLIKCLCYIKNTDIPSNISTSFEVLQSGLSLVFVNCF